MRTRDNGVQQRIKRHSQKRVYRETTTNKSTTFIYTYRSCTALISNKAHQSYRRVIHSTKIDMT